MDWNDLTDRERKLDKAIDRCGMDLNASDACVRQIMRMIGADSAEFGYVKDRVALRLRIQALLDKTDAFISDTEKMLDRFEKEDGEWRRRGRALGLDF